MSNYGQFPDIMYGQRDQERLSARTLSEAVHDIVDQMDLARLSVEPVIEVVVFRRMKASADAEQVLLDLLCQLDENLGDPDGWPTPVKPEHLAAAQTFVDAVVSDYEVYAMEQWKVLQVEIKAVYLSKVTVGDQEYPSVRRIDFRSRRR